MNNQTVVVLDFGGQYKELIARRVRQLNVYSVIKPGQTPLDDIKAMSPIGIILTGGPMSAYSESSPKCDPALFELGIPILGICYGLQVMCHSLGGSVEKAGVPEYGKIDVKVDSYSTLFMGLDESQVTLMSHGDHVSVLPKGFKSIAFSPDCPNAAIQNEAKKLYGLQFHPEVERTKNGVKMIRNFLYNICGAKGDYGVSGYINRQVKAIRAQVRGERVLLALSGGVDSSVCAALLSKAIPGQVTCIFVDHGLMRKNEGDEIEEVFSKRDLHFIRVNAKERFLGKLAGVTDPERKRKIIGAEFIAVFEDEAKKLGNIPYLAQGTIYPDIVESGGNNSANIKSHHNVGGLPEIMDFKGIVEPLSALFKDEVRKMGRKLGLPKELVDRQPFPGPGLAIRIIGDITEEKLEILRDADAIFREEVAKSRVKAQQYFAVLTNIRSVGVMGDSRTYDYTLALRAVNTTDFMTCTYAKLPHSTLERASVRIVNEVKGINRIVYDITGKPPATIEWE
ncbi:MAG: glutamine-hydrolyzing GMP synthase [Christensenellales bacterium]|jgi:GMP synthase (glutamine-hydrolysing)